MEKEKIEEIPVEKLEDPILKLHPNPDINYLRELAESIRKVGQQQPIVVRRRGEKYQVIVGYCRTLAAKTFGIPTLKAIVIECNDAEAMIRAATENIHRLEQDPIMEAKLLKDLKEKYGYSIKRLAEKFARTERYVKSRLSLLELRDEVKELIKGKKLPIGIGEQLARIKDPELQMIAASDFLKNPTTVEHAKAIIDSLLTLPPPEKEEWTEEELEKARQEVKIKCHFCGRNVQYEHIHAYNICDECFHYAIYLMEKEKRLAPREEKGKEEEAESES